jgi:ParB family chromosome partitioning protein
MTELRSVDPRTLKPNPNNPRRTPVPPAMDEQLVASIKAIGIIQPPEVREADGELIVKAGGRRVKAAIAAELPKIAGDAIDAKLFLPNMATEEFLSCLSKAAVEKAAAAEGVKIGSRGKDTRANLIERFKDGTYVHPSALYAPTPDEIADATRHANDWAERSGEDHAGTGDGEGTEDGSEGLGDAEGDPRSGSDEDQLPAAAE